MSYSAIRPVASGSDISLRYCEIRSRTLALCAPLHAEDCGVQSMPDASPTKWHLGHTTWFFEQFVLQSGVPDYRPFDKRYGEIFNSYYQSVGPQHPRGKRSLLSRPTVAEVLQYRHFVDESVQRLLSTCTADEELYKLISLGLHHEQQHQELILTDIKHAFANNPLLPVYRARPRPVATPTALELEFVSFDGGIRWVGANDAGFSFDIERPRHRVVIEPFALANRLVTNEEYLAFVRTGGYRRAEFWLADGWNTVNLEGWSRPLYWQESLDSEFTLHGVEALLPNAPVCHLSFYEVEAFARWAGMRLPTEFEWEVAAVAAPIQGNLIDCDVLHPLPAQSLAISSTAEQATKKKGLISYLVMCGSGRLHPLRPIQATSRR
jgi:ergothioneine biosynthesis protein EgtB